MQRLLLLAAILLLARADSSRVPNAHPALALLPLKMAWAWERPEDLRWLPGDAGVAFVASSIMLQGDGALVRPRTAVLRLEPATARVPVLHVDMSGREPPALNEAQLQAIVKELLRIAAGANRKVVQLDFEVRRSQRPFLARTIATIRRSLPPDVALSVTALASWCLDDAWLAEGMADEVVPMAFRMGQQQHELRLRLRWQGFTQPYCRQAAGYATDEPRLRRLAPRSYYFSPRSWTAAQWQLLHSQSKGKIGKAYD
ncbi:MAG TPA: hypothetical protein VGD52_22265 [Pseudoduganella sp.]